jgi:hypothetical protein
MIDAATRLPLRHISVGVPWHDNGWNGTVSNHPKENAACLVLDQIRETRDDEKEAKNSGRSIAACLRERGGFMSPFEYSHGSKKGSLAAYSKPWPKISRSEER